MGSHFGPCWKYRSHGCFGPVGDRVAASDRQIPVNFEVKLDKHPIPSAPSSKIVQSLNALASKNGFTNPLTYGPIQFAIRNRRASGVWSGASRSWLRPAA
jgi:hypothetical protein